MNVSKPRPSDHPVLVVFVIGGVTVTEARQIQEVVSATKSNMQVRRVTDCMSHCNHPLDELVIVFVRCSSYDMNAAFSLRMRIEIRELR